MAQKYRASRTVGARIHRLNGQIQAVEKMLQRKRSCSDVLQQISAVRAGLEQVAVLVFQRELHRLANRKRIGGSEVRSLLEAFSKTR